MRRSDGNVVHDFEQMIKGLARTRAIMIQTHVMTEEEITEFLNVKGAEYGKHYGSMRAPEILMEMIDELLEG